MFDSLSSFLKHLGCSHCQEFEFQQNYNKENFKDWDLYLKEYEMYSAMILYNKKLDKDISHIIDLDSSIFLLDKENNTYMKLEYISKKENESILVPTDEYQELYETIENMDKKFDSKINGYYIGTYNIKKCK